MTETWIKETSSKAPAEGVAITADQKKAMILALYNAEIAELRSVLTSFAGQGGDSKTLTSLVGRTTPGELELVTPANIRGTLMPGILRKITEAFEGREQDEFLAFVERIAAISTGETGTEMLVKEGNHMLAEAALQKELAKRRDEAREALPSRDDDSEEDI